MPSDVARTKNHMQKKNPPLHTPPPATNTPSTIQHKAQRGNTGVIRLRAQRPVDNFPTDAYLAAQSIEPASLTIKLSLSLKLNHHSNY